MATVVVLSGGPGSVGVADLPAGATVIAADGGAELARTLGLGIDLVVGDLDSISVETLAGIEHVERHAVEKDATDLELALVAALRLDPEQVLVLDGGGGRLDHLLGGLLVLAAEAYAGMRVDAQVGAAAVHVVRGERTLCGEPGELISLFAMHGPARGIETDGLIYPLRGETLEPGSTRGISNVFAAQEVRIALERGVLLAVRPNGTATAGS
ncbi:MAG: thiamine diphosphokinase [Actinobacteria bacterium]|nr:thiamine diphosphokinase [Actinomycetota bacterium]